MDKPLTPPDLVIDKGHTSADTYLSVFVPGEDVFGILNLPDARGFMLASPEGPLVEVICDICHRPFSVPSSMAPASTSEVRYYQMCPDHSAVEQLAFIREVRNDG